MNIFKSIISLFTKQRAYLSGPMTGIKDLNVPAFNHYARKLKADGYSVFNPGDNTSKDWTESMKIDIRELTKAEVVFVMPGWAKSKGVMIECFIAQALSIPVIDVVTMQKVNIDLGILPTPKTNYHYEDIDDEEYWGFFKPFVTNEDGSLDEEQVKAELHDFYFLTKQVPTVYSHITGNRLSKHMFYASTVINAYEAHLQETIDELIKARDEYSRGIAKDEKSN